MDELSREGEIREISHVTASALAGTGLVEVRPEGGAWRILPRGYVGAVRIGDFQVQVTPKDKVGISSLLFLLGYAKDPGFRPEDVLGIEEPDLWPALAESLGLLVERALMRGVLQGYRTMEEALRTVRGRIRMGDQMSRRPGLLTPLEVTYDEFTVDTAENQILRSALRRMLGVPRLRDAAARRLGHLDGRLDGVSVLPPGAPLPTWRPTRINQRYQPALRLAELVLRYASAEPGPGGVRVASFVVSMWKVFEDFVTTALTEALARRPGRTVGQFKDRLDEPRPGQARGDVRMAVDIVHLDPDGSPRLIFDAKYKVADGAGQYPNADHYQMLAYCTALQVPRAWLVYAQGSGGPVDRHVRYTQKHIVEYPLDLSAAPDDLLRQVDVLASLAWHSTLINKHGPSMGYQSPAAASRSL